MKKHLTTAFSLLLLLGSLGCRETPRASCTSAMEKVLMDFEYAGRVNAPADLGSVIPSQNETFPQQLDSDAYYVFYHRLSVQNSEVARVILPKRLREQGCPVGEVALRYPDEGGPLFTINFSGKCEGTLFSVVDRRIIRDAGLRGTWASEAYILQLRKK